MDLLKRHHHETAEPAAATTDRPPPPPPPDPHQRTDAEPQGPAAWDRRPGAGDENPHERETMRTPVTPVSEPTDPRGTDRVPDRFEHAHDEHEDDRRSRNRRRHRKGDGVVDEVVIRSWSIADAVTTAIGGALAVVGGIALARAEVDSTWYEPVVQVAGANHTPLLAAAELAAGILIVLVGVARRRILSTLFGAALAIGGAVLAVQADEVRTELAVESWWAWVLCGAGVLIALMALVPRKGRIERVERPGEPAPVA